MVSGQAFLKGCLDLLIECQEIGLKVTIQRIPGHEGIKGKEGADRAAKRAAIKGVRRRVRPVDETGKGIYWLASAVKRRIQQGSKDAWAKAWERDKAGKPAKQLIKAPNKRTLLYWASLRKATASILTQFRTGRTGSNHYLWKINRRESLRCHCGLGNQTPRHILMVCPLYEDQRRTMWQRIRGVKRTAQAYEIPGEKEAVVAVAEFMVNTGSRRNYPYPRDLSCIYVRVQYICGHGAH
jgi:hypothetical protein